MNFLILVAGTGMAAALTTTVQRQLEAPYWAYFPLALGGGVASYLISLLLIRAFIVRRQGVFDKTEVSPGVQAWELTAAQGIVPRWVSFFGIISPCFLLAIPFELVRLALASFHLI